MDTIHFGLPEKFIEKYGNRNLPAFIVYWLVLFILYLPAAEAGRVGDFPGWVRFLNSSTFLDYINRSESGIASLYQFTQIVTYVFYKIWGANAWLWHLLYITLHTTNTLLLFILFRRLFADAAIKNGIIIAFFGGLIYCLSPHISEVVVWEPAFHYLLGFLLMLIVMLCAQHFMNTGKRKFIWWGSLVFFLSVFSLEVFYLTPFLVFTIILFYRLALQRDKQRTRLALLSFTAPELIIFAAYMITLRTIYHWGIAHIGTFPVKFTVENCSKALKYLFHIVFFGRFFTDAARQKMYHICESLPLLYASYGLVVAAVGYIFLRFHKMKSAGKTVSLVFIWVLACMGLIIPLWFPDTGYVLLDRYTYVLDGFLYMFIVLLLRTYTGKYVFAIVTTLFALINIRFAHKVVAYWQQSAHIVNNLVYTFPNDPAKKVLLLNLPECLHGVQMVGSRDEGEFRMMYNAVMPQKISNPVYDVEAFYMQAPTEGAHVMVVNDTMAHVTLNQWGTWWLYYGFGATSYENADYKVNMRDVGHTYDIVLKYPAEQYLILYVIGDQWKTVDWNKKNVDQY